MAKAKAPVTSSPTTPDPSFSLPPDLADRICAFAAEVGADPRDVLVGRDGALIPTFPVTYTIAEVCGADLTRYMEILHGNQA